jgi:outer membrane protein assembly factor BamD
VKIIILFLIALISSCSSDKPKGKTEAEVLYKESLDLIESERYILATEKINQIKTQHPYSYYATPAELLLAEVQFKQESYIESAASFLLFRDFHPKHERIAYVIFMIAESYFMQLPPTIDRDLESGMEAIKFYKEVVEKYPQSEFVEKALKSIKKIMARLLEKDQYIADFYFKTKEYSAARYWYLDILENHQNEKTRHHAMLRTILASHELKEWQTCLEYVEKFYQLVDKESQKEIRSRKHKCENKL